MSVFLLIRVGQAGCWKLLLLLGGWSNAWTIAETVMAIRRPQQLPR
jgi:hypothetical protein